MHSAVHQPGWMAPVPISRARATTASWYIGQRSAARALTPDAKEQREARHRSRLPSRESNSAGPSLRSASAPWANGLTRAVGRCVKNPRVGEHPATHGLPRLQHADFAAEPESACFELAKGADLQELNAGGGTRTPDTRIMIPLL
jgi:hypothetical protein